MVPAALGALEAVGKVFFPLAGRARQLLFPLFPASLVIARTRSFFPQRSASSAVAKAKGLPSAARATRTGLFPQPRLFQYVS